MNKTNISIVTAFYDIGRGNWNSENGFPSYLQRTTETYIERFSYLAQLHNEIIVFATEPTNKRLQEFNSKNNIKFVNFDLLATFHELRNRILNIQRNESYQQRISLQQRINPEYWNPDYVLVNFMKSYFINTAINSELTTNNLIAWLDFGYCRSENKIPKSKSWSYDFDESKIHLFNYKSYDGIPIETIIANNIVYILGAKMVGGKTAWPKFEQTMKRQMKKLFDHNLVDDDQTLLLMSSLAEPDLIELHKIPDHQVGGDPFVIFSDFNKDIV
jgi:protein YibB